MNPEPWSTVAPLRHDNDLPITIYLTAESSGIYHRVHCLHCGLPVATISARIIRLVDNPANAPVITIGMGNTCKRCKATYRFVLI